METTVGAQPLDEADIEVLRIYTDGSSPLEVAVRLEMRVEQVGVHLAKVRGHLRELGADVDSKQALREHARSRGLLSS